VILHGGPGAHHDYLLPQFLRLAERHTLLFYDQRGGGRSKSDAPGEPITAAVHASDLGTLLAEFSLSAPTIVGYSWGALLALSYTTSARETGTISPRRLVLVDPAPLSRAWRSEFEAEFARRQSDPAIVALRAELAASGLRERDADAYRQRAFELSVAGYFADVTRAHNLTPFRVTGRVQQSVWESLEEFDLIPQLSSLNLPTLMVHGWRDPIPVDSTLAAARAMRARCVVLESSGHVPYVEQPDALFSAIEQFLQDTA
jgi:proline iminopeptidase